MNTLNGKDFKKYIFFVHVCKKFEIVHVPFVHVLLKFSLINISFTVYGDSQVKSTTVSFAKRYILIYYLYICMYMYMYVCV